MRVRQPQRDLPLERMLGHYSELTILRFAAPGAYLGLPDRSDRDAVLLPGAEIPTGARVGDKLEVFLYRDSEGRPVATMLRPHLERGHVAFLRVTACTEIGAFVDWGLAKELLVPFAQQTTEVAAGDRYPIGLYLDSSARLVGTMRVREMLKTSVLGHDFAPDDWVQGEAWRSEADVGLFVIVEKRFLGLVPKTEPHALTRGETARFRIANILQDGKLELTLRGHAHEELAADANRILAVLASPHAPRLGDRSTPEEIRQAVGLSKKAFKRAAGRLLREGALRCTEAGFFVRVP